jgi:hypothetical protein
MPEMRTIRALLRWLSAGTIALVLLLGVFTPVFADTGTYRISDYSVTLEPQNDGTVKITFNQSWLVTGGNIPWITVGLPNTHFKILDFSGAAGSVKAENSGNFSGVRIDLKQKYFAGDSFNLQFSVLQSNLLERLVSEKSWRINYTPGWYDHAAIDQMQIKLVSPVDLSTYTSISPPPLSQQNNIILWQRSSLAAGQRWNILVSSTDGGFLTASAPPEGSSQGSNFGSTFFVVIIVLVAAGGLISLALYRYKKNQEAALQKRITDYEKEMAADKTKQAEIESGFKEYIDQKKITPDASGRYYDNSYGNYITPAIWAAAIYYQQQQKIQNAAAGGVPPSHPHSPSCACVACACACACACAGGGAAGCAKKSLHECPQCHPLVKTD